MRGTETVRRPPADVVLLCDWLPPDFGAVGQYTLQRARLIAAEGRQIVLYGLSSVGHSVKEERFGEGSLRIVRLAARVYDRAHFWQRAWWTARTNLRLVLHALPDIAGCREVLFTGSPPFLLHVIAPLNLLLRRRLVYRITDFFPEVMMATRVRPPWLLWLLYRVTLFWRKRVHRFEALGEDQRQRLLDAGIRAERIVVRRDPSPVQIGSDVTPLKIPPDLGRFKVLLYSGNFGAAHDYETFLSGYVKHHRAGSGSVGLWLNAVGATANAFADALERERLPFCRTRLLPLEQLASLLVAPAAHLITLRDDFWGYVLPSKVYGCIESGKDVVYVGPTQSDVHRLCASRIRGARYWQVDVGDESAVYRVLEELGAR